MLDVLYLIRARPAWMIQNNMNTKRSVQATHLHVLETNGGMVKRNYYPFVPVIRATLIRAVTPCTLSFHRLCVDRIPTHECKIKL